MTRILYVTRNSQATLTPAMTAMVQSPTDGDNLRAYVRNWDNDMPIGRLDVVRNRNETLRVTWRTCDSEGRTSDEMVRHYVSDAAIGKAGSLSSIKVDGMGDVHYYCYAHDKHSGFETDRGVFSEKDVILTSQALAKELRLAAKDGMDIKWLRSQLDAAAEPANTPEVALRRLGFIFNHHYIVREGGGSIAFGNRGCWLQHHNEIDLTRVTGSAAVLITEKRQDGSTAEELYIYNLKSLKATKVDIHTA